MFRIWPFFAARAALRGQTRLLGSAGNAMNAVITKGIGGGGPNLAGPVCKAGGAGMAATEVVATAAVVGTAYYVNKEEQKWGGSPAQTHPGFTGILSGIGCILLAVVSFGFSRPFPESHSAGWFILIMGLVLGTWMLAKGIESAVKTAVGSSGRSVQAKPAPLITKQAYLRDQALSAHAAQARQLAVTLRERGL